MRRYGPAEDRAGRCCYPLSAEGGAHSILFSLVIIFSDTHYILLDCKHAKNQHSVYKEDCP